MVPVFKTFLLGYPPAIPHRWCRHRACFGACAGGFGAAAGGDSSAVLAALGASGGAAPWSCQATVSSGSLIGWTRESWSLRTLSTSSLRRRQFGPCRGLVKRGPTDLGSSVFIGLPSEREAKIVVAAAGQVWPQLRQ